MAIIYAVVARGSVVLAEHTDSQGNFITVTHRILEKIPNESDFMKSYKYDQYVIYSSLFYFATLFLYSFQRHFMVVQIWLVCFFILLSLFYLFLVLCSTLMYTWDAWFRKVQQICVCFFVLHFSFFVLVLSLSPHTETTEWVFHEVYSMTSMFI